MFAFIHIEQREAVGPREQAGGDSSARPRQGPQRQRLAAGVGANGDAVRAAFIAEPERYGSAERFLRLGIEATLDMGSHIVADQDLGSIEQSRDIPRRFREHGRISADLERRWVAMIGVRNILVHEYLAVDREIVHEVVCNRLKDLAELKQVFAEFL